jgi:prepilin-type N-terminal cleavage/methylation domain-containing protein/prepilin-type processing-associated H-X9-DG protein
LNTNTPRRHRQRGFTLIELLVVISIVAAILALLLPSLSAARATSKAMVCLTSERQMYNTFNQFAFDNKQSIPYVTYYWQILANGQYISDGSYYPGALNGMRYKMFKCASDEGSIIPNDPSGLAKPMFDHPWLPSSYAMNTAMSWASSWNSGTITTSRFGERSVDCRTTFGNGYKVNNISELSFMMDSPTWGWGWDQPLFNQYMDNPSVLDKTRYSFRHPNATANILYMDGHAASAQHALYTGRLIFAWKYP